VHVWIYNSKGRVILQKRAEGKDTFPGRWDVSVGGHVTSGDSGVCVSSIYIYIE